MTFALLYCRVESGSPEERRKSLAVQAQLLTQDAVRRGFEYEVVREDRSEGSLGSHDRLAAALDLLEMRQADVLMAVRLDLLDGAEDGTEALLKRSAAQGWGLIIAGESLGSGPVSPRFREHLDELAATRLRSQLTREGIRRRRTDGGSFGRVVDESFLPTYRRVLTMASNGASMNEIARVLNREGIPTARGATWHASTVRAILSSETAKKLA